MKTTIIKNLAFLVLGTAALTACKKEEVTTPKDDHEEELITTLILNFKDKNNSAPDVTAAFRDPDGVGGNAPTQFDTIKLKANTVYNVTVDVLNESENPADTITKEIEDEKSEHIFCYEGTTDSISVKRTDTDGTYEVGLTSEWTAKGAASGNVKVTLKHQDDGTKNGTCTPGDTDIEVNFPLEIK